MTKLNLIRLLPLCFLSHVASADDQVIPSALELENSRIVLVSKTYDLLTRIQKSDSYEPGKTFLIETESERVRILIENNEPLSLGPEDSVLISYSSDYPEAGTKIPSVFQERGRVSLSIYPSSLEDMGYAGVEQLYCTAECARQLNPGWVNLPPRQKMMILEVYNYVDSRINNLLDQEKK
jgi:hypothetical protein